MDQTELARKQLSLAHGQPMSTRTAAAEKVVGAFVKVIGGWTIMSGES